MMCTFAWRPDATKSEKISNLAVLLGNLRKRTKKIHDDRVIVERREQDVREEAKRRKREEEAKRTTQEERARDKTELDKMQQEMWAARETIDTHRNMLKKVKGSLYGDNWPEVTVVPSFDDAGTYVTVIENEQRITYRNCTVTLLDEYRTGKKPFRIDIHNNSELKTTPLQLAAKTNELKQAWLREFNAVNEYGNASVRFYDKWLA